MKVFDNVTTRASGDGQSVRKRSDLVAMGGNRDYLLAGGVQNHTCSQNRIKVPVELFWAPSLGICSHTSLPTRWC